MGKARDFKHHVIVEEYITMPRLS